MDFDSASSCSFWLRLATTRYKTKLKKFDLANEKRFLKFEARVLVSHWQEVDLFRETADTPTPEFMGSILTPRGRANIELSNLSIHTSECRLTADPEL